MGMNFVWFMLFSTIEGFAVYALTLYTFRLDFRKYFWHSLVIIELINLQNFLTREEVASLSYLAPAINFLITVLFLRTIVRIPLFWSLLMTSVGYAAYIALQTALITIFFSVEEVQSIPVKGYTLQFLTGVLGVLIGWGLYRQGIGFTFDFERLRIKWEHILVIVLIIVFIFFLTLMMYSLNVFGGLIGFLICLIVFLFYSIRKETIES
ncbi:hypothetical protein [Paenibacillus sp. GCM10027626]|uniref:hypothetical protein n=1 Tax=Paenibacillus sp. GCM10027626 TaxID=3273411 RepID=UPI00362C53EB